MTRTKQFALLIIVIFCFLVSLKLKSLINYPDIKVDKQISKVTLSPVLLKLLSFGQERMLSSLLWIDVLMDADNEHYKFRDLNSWMYLRFMTIAKLDPYFYENYLYGGIYLSIIKDDDLGAKEIYDQGLIYYPNSFELLKNAAFHYRFELEDYVHAQSLYERLAQNPAASPYDLSLLARLRSHHNDLEGAWLLLFDIYQKAPEGSKLKEKVFESLYAIRAELDLKCLNSSPPGNDCKREDFKGQPYVRDSQGVFKAVEEFQNYKLKRE